jgi:hypothetical protein
VVFKSFFDGGNEADSTQYDFVSLASVSGTETQWRAFERDWGAVLKKHNAPWLHTTDVLISTNRTRGHPVGTKQSAMIFCLIV